MNEHPMIDEAPERFAYLAELNEAQRAAVEALDGPVLLLAGAGTGKTRALTTRLAHILATGRVASPGQILAVTFTNKAARQMKDRVAALLGRSSVEGWWLGTFHSQAARILRERAEAVGLRRDFTILDADDQLRLLKQLLAAENIDDKKWPARSLMAVIQRWKDRGLTPDRVSADDGASELAGGRMLRLFRAYQERLITLNACDFGDLLLHNLTIFQSDPKALADYHRRFRYILVDEYQDTNVAQYLWLRLLAQQHHNICCVGDDDQSIYGWRGAEVGNILRFETDFPGARVIRLERNYRSTGRILAAASGLIAHNEDRLGKTLWTEGEEGEKIRLRGLWDGEGEARFVGEEIEDMQRRDPSLDLNEIAILVRAGSQTREFEERFLTLGLPYRVVGGPRFYERLEIRDALAYLRVVHSTSDDLAFERIVNKPKRGLGEATLQSLHQAARGLSVPLFEAARRLIGTEDLRPAARRSLAALIDDFERWREQARAGNHVELTEIVLEESGYIEMWRNDKTIEAPGRLENLKELVAAVAEFDTLAGFLEHVSLVMEALEAEGGSMVSVMTLHAAKGLEFDTVFLPGWEEGLFPNQRTLDEGGQRSLEEERRLAYVGLTRARKRAIVSFAANRRMYGSWMSTIPSRFIEDLPADQIEMDSDQGIYGSSFAGGGEWSDAWSNARSSPGLARARVRRQAAPYIELEAREVQALPSDSMAIGARVFHRKFGYGAVRQVEGEKLTIAFDKAGEKKVMANFVVPATEAS
jgi:DNA helicase-2/ATP-dependent DNA helicase PcrA